MILQGAAAAEWSEHMASATRALRLNKHFPPWKRLADHLRVMADPGSTTGGEVRLDPASGLPVPREWIRVRMDQQMASETLAQFADVDAASLPEPDAGALTAKRAYLQRLIDLEALPSRAVTVALRHREGGRASYLVIVDRLDLATATLARYTMIIEDEPGRRVSPGELELRASEAFTDALEVLSTQDAALAFAALREEGLGVLEVVRGVVGPARFGAVGPPAVAAASGPILSAALERASVDLSAGRIDDPLALQVTVPASDVDFGVSWQRKWAVPRSDKDTVRAWLKQHGSRNLVYPY